jgi:hypothetical protein
MIGPMRHCILSKTTTRCSLRSDRSRRITELESRAWPKQTHSFFKFGNRDRMRKEIILHNRSHARTYPKLSIIKPYHGNKTPTPSRRKMAFTNPSERAALLLPWLVGLIVACSTIFYPIFIQSKTNIATSGLKVKARSSNYTVPGT